MENGIVIGHRWVGGIGSKTCNLCREMIGKEFYINPKPGQLRYPDDIPVKPPIHPNCRCKLEPITDYLAVVEKGRQDHRPITRHNPYLHDSGAKILGGHFGNDGRSWRAGPAYGNYCGKNWTAGRNQENVKQEEDPSPFPEPVDDLDALCKRHDEGYDRSAASSNPKDARNRYDEVFYEKVKQLPVDPRKWDKPPDSTIDGFLMRQHVLFWFGNKIKYHRMEKKHGRVYMAIYYPELYVLFSE